MKSVLISIRPKWCELIASGEKTIEVRKTRPKIPVPFKCYIYCTRNARDPDKLWVLNKQRRQEYGGLTAVCANLAERPDYHYCGDGKVIGEFVCDHVERLHAFLDIQLYTSTQGTINCISPYIDWFLRESLVSPEEIDEYAKGCGYIYGWHISDLKIYDVPKDLKEFTTFCNESENRCANCKHYLFDKDELNGYQRWCGVCNRKPLTRPPRSWTYVEEKDEN